MPGVIASFAYMRGFLAGIMVGGAQGIEQSK
jgi:hypothetical protein